MPEKISELNHVETLPGDSEERNRQIAHALIVL